MKKQCDIGRELTIGNATIKTRCIYEVHGDDTCHYDGHDYFVTFPLKPGDKPQGNPTIHWVPTDS